MDSPSIVDSPPTDSSCLKPPALPERSSLRSSRLLEPLAFKNALAVEQPPLSPVSAPHDVYLSSEEDASSSADDFSDYEFGSESDMSLASPDLRTQQDTARVVSVIFHGKPSLVNLSPRSTSPTSSASQSSHGRTSSGSPPTPAPAIFRSSTVSDMDYRRSSVASTASSTFFNFSRSSTMTLGSTSSRPAFLSIDPFASKSSNRESDEIDRPKTPTAILKRKLTLSKKRSKPLLNDVASQPQESFSPRTLYNVQAEAQPRTQEKRPSTPRTGVSYQDIMKAARGAAATSLPPPPPPPEPESRPSKGARSRLRNLSISRKLSVKS
jgi:hypothetical protein